MFKVIIKTNKRILLCMGKGLSQEKISNRPKKTRNTKGTFPRGVKTGMEQEALIVTIDGPAGSGKSTVSRRVADALGFSYLDTGAMYRAVALAAKWKEIRIDDGAALGALCRELDLRFVPGGDMNRVFLGEEDVGLKIRTPEMDMLSSSVSAVPEVRKAMTELQRRMGREGRVVAEGRDMGTVVFPGAPYKFFLTAAKETRAGRRYRERIERGENVVMARVEEDLENRDRQDGSRALAPLKPAEDAVVIDTTHLTEEQVVSRILGEINPEG